jgi:hypothetical protein
MHQYKVNAKAAFDGEIWQWHQAAAARAMMSAIQNFGRVVLKVEIEPWLVLESRIQWSGWR